MVRFPRFGSRLWSVLVEMRILYLIVFSFLLGKDSGHVFYLGQIVPNAHPYSFRLIDKTYAKDHQNVFQYGQIVGTLQPSPFHESMTNSTLSSIPSYEIRDFKVFFGEKHLPDARWIDFTNLGHGYGKSRSQSILSVHRISYIF